MGDYRKCLRDHHCDSPDEHSTSKTVSDQSYRSSGLEPVDIQFTLDVNQNVYTTPICTSEAFGILNVKTAVFSRLASTNYSGQRVWNGERLAAEPLAIGREMLRSF